MAEPMTLAIVGHVDHGKSTTIGRLLADTGVLPEGKLEQIRRYCEQNAKPFEYAFLLDALHDERSQGITIDSARVFFKSGLRRYLVMDTPGHLEFLKNMVTGASQADAALFVVDAVEGLRENSLRHAHMLSLLGIERVMVLINKMDLASYSQTAFEKLRRDILEFMAKVKLEPLHFIPISGMNGENLARRSEKMPWYRGPCLLEALDGLSDRMSTSKLPFRLPVQDVYRFTENGDDRRIIAGQVESGTLRTGDKLTFYPSNKSARVQSIENFGGPATAEVTAGGAAGFTLDQPLYLRRGELAAKAEEKPPRVAAEIRVNLFWLGKRPLEKGREYIFKCATARVNCVLASIDRVLDASTLAIRGEPAEIGRYEVADCVLRLESPVAFDILDGGSATNRFVLVDEFEIRGGGIIRESLQEAVRVPAVRLEPISESASVFYGINCLD